MRARSSGSSVKVLASFPSFRWASKSVKTVTSRWNFLSPPFMAFWALSMRRSTISMSAITSSRLMMSISRRGSVVPSTWVTLLSSKQRTTWTMASVVRMLLRNLLPRPSPLLAPFTRPAMSTNSTMAGVVFLGLCSSDSQVRRSSGTETTPTLGSMVQKA